ncbi:MAG: polyprenyl synthetase family protein [Candidatus Omnitrophica bacterium]|nr:polyprenyl synthetase family protein [Candidatus Omnitrophota bacterium]
MDNTMRPDYKKLINAALTDFINNYWRRANLSRIGSSLPNALREFILRDGKRIRPLLFLLSYQGYANVPRVPPAMITCAGSFELLHDFLLIHDDIIDNSPLRRGKPTLHKVLQRQLRQTDKIGTDLAIVAGDIVYAMAVDAFLAAPESCANRTEALRFFLQTTALTGAGEYIDVLNGLRRLPAVGKKSIRLNYLLKTAEYTFKAPLVCGCLLANGYRPDIAKLSRYAETLGVAFQIQDDLIGLFSDSATIGKSVLSDIKEAKKTLPLFYAYQRSGAATRKFLAQCVGNRKLTFPELRKIQKIVIAAGARDTATADLRRLLRQADKLLAELHLAADLKQQLTVAVDTFIKR